MTNLFRPCIDLHDGVVKQIVGSTLSDDPSAAPQTNFVAAEGAAHFARLYRDDGLGGGHVIQLGSGNEKAARQALAAWPGGLQVGGGVTPENAASWLDAGASHVIVTSYLFSHGRFHAERLPALLKETGREHLVLDLSCRKMPDGSYRIAADRWQTLTELALDAPTLDELANYASEFLVHAVDVEGKRSGVDAELIRLLADHAPVPAVYAGGIGSYSDIEKIETLGRHKVAWTVGSALDLFGGSLSYRLLADREKRRNGGGRPF